MSQFKQLGVSCIIVLFTASSTPLAFAATTYGFVPTVPNIRLAPGISAHKKAPASSFSNDKKVDELLLQLENVEQICELEDNFAGARNVLYTELSLLKENNIHNSVLVGSIYSRIAALYSMEKMFPEAEQNYKLAVSNLRDGAGNVSLEVALNLNNLGWSQFKQKHFNDAEVSYRKGLFIFSKSVGEKNIFYAMSACNLGDLYLKSGRALPALNWYRKASQAFDASLGKDEPVSALVRKRYESLKNQILLKSRIQGKSTESTKPNNNKN